MVISLLTQKRNSGIAFDDNSGFEFAFPHDAWFLVGVEVDTDNELLSILINGELAEQFSYNDFADRFDGIDFYSIDSFALFYVDNVEFSQGPLVQKRYLLLLIA